jgi:hypothetical protein
MFAGVFAPSSCAQDLAPRAYTITPLRSNAIIVTESFFNGSIDYDGVVPISNATGTYNVPSLSYYHAFDFFGRSANIVASLPYGVGNFRGTVGTDMQVYRSGLVDSVYRVAVNLKGGPAMPVEKLITWKEKRLIGLSLKVIAPTGQYDPTKLVTGVLTGGPSSLNSATRKPGTNGFWTHTLECGSSPPIRSSIRAMPPIRESVRNHKSQWWNSKGISATTSNPGSGSRSTAIIGSAEKQVWTV